MSAKSAKRLINWHTGWLGEKDSNGDLVGDWAQFFDKEQFKCRYCDVVRKYSNGGRTSQAEVLVDESDLFHFLYEHYPQCTYVTE